MYRIVEKQVLSDVTKLIVVEAPHVTRRAKAGQFVIVICDEQGERVPLTIADHDQAAGTITLIFQEVGKSTMQLGMMEPGEGLFSVAGPLGHPTEIENYGTVVCVAGGVGIAPMYPIARDLQAAGNRVISIIGARNKELLFWEDRMRAVSDELIVCTDDGSYGIGHGALEGVAGGARARHRTHLGHRPHDHDEVRLADYPTFRRPDYRQLEHDHGGWHRHVWRLPCADERRRSLRMRRRAGVRRPSGGLGKPPITHPVLSRGGTTGCGAVATRDCRAGTPG
jgi:NAD(P)H-flavin reductase